MVNPTASYRLKHLTSYWDKFVNQSTNRKIFGAAVIIGICSISVKAVGMLRELVVAYTFGTSDSLDAFIIAYILPSFTVSIVSSSFNAAVIPTYIQERQDKGRKAAEDLAGSILVLSVLLLFSILLILALTGPLLLPLVGSGFDAEKLALTQKIFYFLLPVILLNGLGNIFSAILNAEENFAFVAISPAIIATVSIFTMLFFASALGIYALVLGVLTGFALQVFMLIWGLKKKDIRLRPKWIGLTPPIRQVIQQYLPILGGTIIMSGTYLVDQSMAAMLDSGSVSAP